MKSNIDSGQLKVEQVIRDFVANLKQDHLDLEPNAELDEDDLEQIDLLAEYESITFINTL